MVARAEQLEDVHTLIAMVAAMEGIQKENEKRFDDRYLKMEVPKAKRRNRVIISPQGDMTSRVDITGHCHCRYAVRTLVNSRWPLMPPTAEHRGAKVSLEF